MCTENFMLLNIESYDIKSNIIDFYALSVQFFTFSDATLTKQNTL